MVWKAATGSSQNDPFTLRATGTRTATACRSPHGRQQAQAAAGRHHAPHGADVPAQHVQVAGGVRRQGAEHGPARRGRRLVDDVAVEDGDRRAAVAVQHGHEKQPGQAEAGQAGGVPAPPVGVAHVGREQAGQPDEEDGEGDDVAEEDADDRGHPGRLGPAVPQRVGAQQRERHAQGLEVDVEDGGLPPPGVGHDGDQGDQGDQLAAPVHPLDADLARSRAARSARWPRRRRPAATAGRPRAATTCRSTRWATWPARSGSARTGRSGRCRRGRGARAR